MCFNMEEKEIRYKEYKRFCPVRKSKKGPKPKFTASGVKRKESERLSAWEFVDEIPDSSTVKRMFCDALGLMIEKTMRLHDFKFNGKIYRQKKGGAIGMDLTGVIADVYMCEWDKVFIGKLREKGYECKVYKRYKDDINVILSQVERKHDDREGIMNELKEIADEIDPSLTVKTDVAESYIDKKLPILDLKVWIGKSKNGESKILYGHYMKEVSDRRVIHAQSAHGDRMKQSVMVNDVCRVIENCSERIEGVSERDVHVNHYMRRMQFSGYNEEQRYDVVKKAMKKYERKKKIRKTGQSSRKGKDGAWYLEGGKNETVMFIDSTPGEVLKKKIERLVKKYKMKIKVVERRGRTVKTILQKSYPFDRMKCKRSDCFVCKDDKKVNCRARGVIYEIQCEEDGCGMKYIGQTSRSVYERMKEHNNWNERSKEDSGKPLIKHSREFHGGGEFRKTVRIKDSMYGKPSKRMIGEAVYINDLLESEAMNGKMEWTFVNL